MGIAQRLYEIYGPVAPDWLCAEDEDIPLLRDIFGQGIFSNCIIAAYGQYLGVRPLDHQASCMRCLNNDLRAFGSCRVSGFVDGDKRYILAKGSCMCCFFSGFAAKCSLRAEQPAWAVEFLLTLRPDFSYEALDDEETGGVARATPSVANDYFFPSANGRYDQLVFENFLRDGIMPSFSVSSSLKNHHPLLPLSSIGVLRPPEIVFVDSLNRISRNWIPPLFHLDPI